MLQHQFVAVIHVLSIDLALKQLTSRCSIFFQFFKNKITVNTGQSMLSREIYYYWPLNLSKKVDKIVGKTSLIFALPTALLTQ